MKKVLLLLVLLFAVNNVKAQHFKVDSSVPTEELKEELRKFYKKKVEGKKVLKILIEGHTDVRASESYNLALSKRRALAALKELKKMGLKANEIYIKGMGESRPISDIHGENRRVVIRVKTDKGSTVTVIKECEPKKIYKKNRLRGLAGVGPTGVGLAKSGNSATVFEETGLVLGLGYDRSLNETLNIGIQIQTNETYMLSIGVDF